jgi:hypothetical protein
MAIEAIEDRPQSARGTGGENGPGVALGQPVIRETFGYSEVTKLTERLDDLERENRQRRRESLWIAALATITAVIVASMVLEKAFEPPKEAEPIGVRRAITAQSFVLTDPQGHPRAKLTVE